MKNKWFLISLIIGIVLISGCAQPQAPPVKTIVEQTEGGPSGSSVSATTTNIIIQNFAFIPAEITIKKGGNVTWMNSDKVAHTVTSSTNEFDSGQIQPGNKFSHEFDNVGTFEYSCTIHPTMKGKVTVT